MQNDKTYQKYSDEIIILLGTGLRISELCGLTETDIDFEKKLINDRPPTFETFRSGRYYIETPKTKSGTRQIPYEYKGL